MKITVLGTGVVGQTIAKRLSGLGHDLIMGTRNPAETRSRTVPNAMTGMSFSDWYKENEGVQLAPFEQAAEDAELIFNATSGAATLDILGKITAVDLQGKILIDLSNPLDFSQGFPPSLFISNTDSLGEQVQAAFPDLKVVKTLNTMNTYIMMHPRTIAGPHNVFVSGNDNAAKATVGSFLKSIGWEEEEIIDLGDITTARGTEMLLPLWLRLYGALGHANFNFHIQKSK